MLAAARRLAEVPVPAIESRCLKGGLCSAADAGQFELADILLDLAQFVVIPAGMRLNVQTVTCRGRIAASDLAGGVSRTP